MHLIILGKMNPLDPDNTNNQIILILKFYLYKCRCLGDKPSINGGLKYLKYCIKIEKDNHKFPISYRVNLVTNPVKSHEWGDDREVFATSGTYLWSFVSPFIIHLCTAFMVKVDRTGDDNSALPRLTMISQDYNLLRHLLRYNFILFIYCRSYYYTTLYCLHGVARRSIIGLFFTPLIMSQ